MLQKNANGESIPIEEIFHTIYTRLYNIKNGFDDAPIDFSSPEECISLFRNNILGFPAEIALQHCIRCNESAKSIRENSEVYVKKFPYTTSTWENLSEEDFYKNKLQGINDELDRYISSLTNFENELAYQNAQLFSIPGVVKTRLNLTVPQLSYLLRLLLDEREKIFDNPNVKELSRNISRVFSSKGSDNNNPDHIYNHIYQKSSAIDTKIIEFWKEKLLHFLQHCNSDLK